MKKKARATGTVKYQFSVLKMAGKFNYVIEGEGSEKYTFLPWGERGKREAFRQLSTTIFFESKECLRSSEIKEDAYVSFSGEMKTKCIRIDIVVVARTDYIWLFTTWF